MNLMSLIHHSYEPKLSLGGDAFLLTFTSENINDYDQYNLTEKGLVTLLANAQRLVDELSKQI